MTRRLLARFLSQGYSAHDLARVTVLRNPKDSVPRVIALGPGNDLAALAVADRADQRGIETGLGQVAADRFGAPHPTPDNVNDLPSLQNGAKLFVNYCLNCHSAAKKVKGAVQAADTQRDVRNVEPIGGGDESRVLNYVRGKPHV